MHTESFAFYIAMLRKHFVAYCTEKLAELEVTYGQLFILIYIGKKKECSPKEISEYLRLDAGQLNRTLAKLTEKKLIDQRKNSSDKRANIVNLTEQGDRIVEESRNLFYTWDDTILSGMEEDRRQKLMESMKMLILGLENKYGGKKNEAVK